ncbi:UDP-N-acetylglucosamine transporter [Amphibalanus amphitrite]|uniref:UDP-N-acetylglucosamine transporter n=1 Tax=Amphibalanus amphitrite TaxID=1232801 RepID=A0A6A4W827_AMPAM|nr:UDP-N-acetylglucosamine transporter [Amphibalanus amphitrite]
MMWPWPQIGDILATMGAVPLKWLTLLVITVQTTALVLVMRYSRANASGRPYFASTAVLLTEAAKMTAVLLTLWLENGRSVARTAALLRRDVWGQPRDTAQLAVPSFLYTIQNNLVFVALTNLDAPTFQVRETTFQVREATFQVLYQLKILVTALMSSVMLKRRVGAVQWVALLVLVVGVGLVQVDRTAAADGRHRHTNHLVGLLAVLALCMSSGYAGVFFERVLKHGAASQSLSVRNMQLCWVFLSLCPGWVSLFLSLSPGWVFLSLCPGWVSLFLSLSPGWVFLSLFSALFSVPFGAVAAALNDGAAIAEHGFFYGYTGYTWAVIALQALGGLAVSATVKYADNILKGFATSISILLSVLISWGYLGDVSLSAGFAAGALLVVGATFLYSCGRPPPRPAAAAAAAARHKVE